jgi:ribosomal protein S18 acetylase RimI-like enzyme
VPFTIKEMDDFANRYLYLINPRFIKIVVDENDEVLAFIIAMSDISAGIQKSKGYLFPTGFYHILTAGRKSDQLNLLLGGIDPRYQGRGIDVMMGMKMLESAKKAGKKVMDSHLELETNLKVRAEMEKMGGKVYKVYRIYQKDIG